MAYPLPIASILKPLLKRFGLESQMQVYTLMDRWEKLVGSQIAAHTFPYQLKFKKIYLYVDSPTWMNQLNYLKEELKKKINQEVGENWVKEIVLKIGPVQKADKTQETEEKGLPEKTISLSPEEKELIEKCVAELDEKELKEKMKRIIARGIVQSRKE